MVAHDDILTPQQLDVGFRLVEAGAVMEVRRWGIRVASFQTEASPETVRAMVDLIMSEEARLKGSRS